MQTVKSKDGTVLTENNDVKNRWKENYHELYNIQNPVNETMADTIPHMPGMDEEPPILREEVAKAIKEMAEGKAPGYDCVTGEELKASGEAGIDILHKLCNQIWKEETFPEDWGKAIITPIFKKKDKLDCSNYRGISLLSHAGKIFTYILQKRIQLKAEEILSESQAGFRPGRSTVDQLFSLRQIGEKYMEKNRDIYICYIDFEKAFDSVWQEGIWKALALFGFPNKITRLLKDLYDKSQSCVRVNGDLTDWFQTKVGVRQGCIISPQLFNILLELVMAYATTDSAIGIHIQGQLINNLRFADDIALLAENNKDLQSLVTSVYNYSKNLGLKINIGKTEVQAMSKKDITMNISINGTQLNQVENFIYLGGKISQKGSCCDDVKHRIGKSLGAVQSLNVIWKSKDISIATKVKLYQTLILSILTYGSETWTLKKEDENRLLVFEMMCLRKIGGFSRMDRIRNTTIRNSLDVKQNIIDQITLKRLRYYGHVMRMNPQRLPYISLNGRVQGNRPRGRPAKRWLDSVKSDVNRLNLTIPEASRQARSRADWKEVVQRMASLNLVGADAIK